MKDRAGEILREDGLSDLLRSIVTWGAGVSSIEYRRLRHRINRKRSPAKYTTADPFKIIAVDPTEVYNPESEFRENLIEDSRVILDDDGRFHKWKTAGFVIDGNWDDNFSDHFPFEQAVIRRFGEGVPWSETEYFAEKMAIVDNGEVWRKCEAKSDVLATFERWDQLYHSIREDGYRRNPPEGVFGLQHTFDEVTVNIGRDGRLIRNSSGEHRLSIARALDLDAIPVRVLVRHSNWEAIRRSINNNSKPETTEYADHPDLTDVI